jgi:tRNA A37 threonylcarbamoyladenosine synthetase subunit TsaC/SUA5/YrdC
LNSQVGFRTFCDSPSGSNLFDFNYTLQNLLQNSLKMVWPHGNLTIVTQSSKQVDSVKATKSDSEFLHPSMKILCQILTQFQLAQIFSDMLDC